VTTNKLSKDWIEKLLGKYKIVESAEPVLYRALSDTLERVQKTLDRFGGGWGRDAPDWFMTTIPDYYRARIGKNNSDWPSEKQGVLAMAEAMVRLAMLMNKSVGAYDALRAFEKIQCRRERGLARLSGKAAKPTMPVVLWCEAGTVKKRTKKARS